MNEESKTYYRSLPDGSEREASEMEREAAFKERGRLRKLRRNIQRAQNKVAKIMEGCQHEVGYNRSHGGHTIRRCVSCSHESLITDDPVLQQPFVWDDPDTYGPS